MFIAAQMYRQLWPILHHWFEQRFVCIASSIVVNFLSRICQVSARLFNKVFLISCCLLKRFPFDSDSLAGYSIAVILEYIIFGYSYFVCATIFALGIGLFWFGISLIKEIRCILHSINGKIRVNKNQSKELKVLFSELIYILHSRRCETI